MSDLDNPIIAPHYERLVKFAQECGLNPGQLQKLISLVSNLINARASFQRQKKRDASGPLQLFNGTGL